jgi:hypothetical protein
MLTAPRAQEFIPQGIPTSGENDPFEGITRFKLGTLEAAEVEINPKRAEVWTGLNDNYREHVEFRSKTLSVQMSLSWDVNGETIKFALRDGRWVLVDGQHRLRACILANVPFTSLVVWGVQSDLAIDTGAVRQLADVLHSRGERNSAALAAAVRWMWKYEGDNLRATGEQARAAFVTLLNVLQRHPQLRESVTVAHSVKEIMPHSPAAFLHYAFGLKDASAADKFFEALATGVNLQNDSAIYHLRRRLIRDRDATKAKLRLIEKLGLTIKAWNLWVQGRTCGVLKIVLSGPHPEPFPTIEGPLGRADI